MKFELRDYQSECVNVILEKFNTLDSQIVQLPTGSGKTVILWHVAKQMGLKTLVIAPTRELTEQIEDTGRDIVDPRYLHRKTKSYWPVNMNHIVMTGQAGTFALKGQCLDNFNPDLLIVDEAHRSMAKSTEIFINHFKDKGCKILGLTATPERLDGKSLLDVFDELTYSTTLIHLINEGYLVDLECFKIKTKHKIKTKKYIGGDLAASSLRELDVSGRNDIILNVYKTKCPGKKTLVFCLNVNHAKKMSDLFVENGIRSMAIYGSLCMTARKSILKMFKEGEIDVLCNCQLLTEGFDEPSIESLILARPTKSKSLYCQMIGRGVRPFKDKDRCLIYDLTDEIHNICSFNVLGNINPHSKFEWKAGERLTHAVERQKLSIEDVDYEFEEFNLYEKRKIDSVFAHKHQKETLDLYGIPYLNDITMEQAAYLLFKNQLLRVNGFDSENYWKKWRHVQRPS